MWAMRVVSTRVLPVPAPASTSTGPSSVSTARRCSGFRSVEIAVAPGTRRHRARGNAARRRGGRGAAGKGSRLTGSAKTEACP